MAFRKITEGDMLGKGNVGRPDTPGVSTAEMQRIMDELPREVLAPAFNELAGQLEAETAAADIGAAAPEGVTAAPAGKLQAVLNGLRDRRGPIPRLRRTRPSARRWWSWARATWRKVSMTPETSSSRFCRATGTAPT